MKSSVDQKSRQMKADTVSYTHLDVYKRQLYIAWKEEVCSTGKYRVAVGQLHLVLWNRNITQRLKRTFYKRVVLLRAVQRCENDG